MLQHPLVKETNRQSYHGCRKAQKGPAHGRKEKTSMEAIPSIQAPAVRIHPPIPVQGELMQIDGSVALLEYQAAFRNEYVHLPEVALRYLIYLITSDKPENEIKRFALQIRNDLNAEGLERLRRLARETFINGAGE